jgi:hypothetical protein
MTKLWIRRMRWITYLGTVICMFFWFYLRSIHSVWAHRIGIFYVAFVIAQGPFLFMETRIRQQPAK